MNRDYETAAYTNYNDSAKYQRQASSAGFDPNWDHLAQAQIQDAVRQHGPIGAERPQTELESLLSTIRAQAAEIRSHVGHVFARVVPQPEEDRAEKVAFSGGYVGQAEEVRSIQAETIRILIELSKYA